MWQVFHGGLDIITILRDSHMSEKSETAVLHS